MATPYKAILSILLILFSKTTIQGAYVNAPIETFFLPKDSHSLHDKLFVLLNKANAKRQVMVAMYWLTDDKIIHRLISLKSEGVDVQIILDESLKNLDHIIQTLMRNDITPYVSFSDDGQVKMHNKFLVIDNQVVVTGSANFTDTALARSTDRYNNENVVIMYSEKIADTYTQEFFDIQQRIARSYIDFISHNKFKRCWIKEISSKLYETNKDFSNLVIQQSGYYTPIEQNRLKLFFEGPASPPDKPVTYNQKRELLKHGYCTQDITRMSQSEASAEIEEMRKLKGKKSSRYQPYKK